MSMLVGDGGRTAPDCCLSLPNIDATFNAPEKSLLFVDDGDAWPPTHTLHPTCSARRATSARYIRNTGARPAFEQRVLFSFASTRSIDHTGGSRARIIACAYDTLASAAVSPL